MEQLLTYVIMTQSIPISIAFCRKCKNSIEHHCTFSTLTYCNFYVRGIIVGFLYLNILRAVERNCVLLDLKLFFNPPYQCAFLTGLTFEVELNPHHVIILSNQVPDNIINAGHVALS